MRLIFNDFLRWLWLAFRVLLLGGLIAFAFCFDGYGQVKDEPLLVGSKLSASFFSEEYDMIVDGKVVRRSLAAFKGKPLLLDFWASWCAPCFKKMPLLDSLVKIHGDGFGVLMVNEVSSGDDLDLVRLKLGSLGDGFSLPTVLKDRFLGRVFPHGQLPFYVWIDKNGFVQAFSGAKMVTEDLVLELLKYSGK